MGWRRPRLPEGSRTSVPPGSLEDFTSVFGWERVWPLRCGRHTLCDCCAIASVIFKFCADKISDYPLHGITYVNIMVMHPCASQYEHRRRHDGCPLSVLSHHGALGDVEGLNYLTAHHKYILPLVVIAVRIEVYPESRSQHRCS